MLVGNDNSQSDMDLKWAKWQRIVLVCLWSRRQIEAGSHKALPRWGGDEETELICMHLHFSLVYLSHTMDHLGGIDEKL